MVVIGEFLSGRDVTLSEDAEAVLAVDDPKIAEI